MNAPPVGTVTFLMTDIEGSTRLWEQQGEDFIPLLEAHNRLVRDILGAHRGYEVRTEGDSFFFVFDSAHDALAGAVELQHALHRENLGIRIRIGIHTGDPTFRDNDYFGPPVNRCGRIRDAGHGGQTLLSSATYALVRDHPPPGVSFLDRGEHRLRDLGAAERLYQVQHPELPRDFPPLRTLEAQPNNLPAQRTSFVGRQRELAMLHDLLGVRGSRPDAHYLTPTTRLITLTGPGGVGKTRLALQVAADHLVDFVDGVWFVPLATVEDPARVVPEIAAVVLGKVAPPQDLFPSLVDYLRDKRALLVLDNFEHLLPAASALGELLVLLPRLTCLVTSRALLHLSGEYEFPVASLSDAESLQLFLERGQAARPGLTLDAANLRAAALICQQLDGLPLAIELAAARLRGMTPMQIEQRLGSRFDILSGGGHDLPNRQRTMRAVLDWSYDLLNPDERRLLGQLSVFAGGFFLEGAEEVCDAGDVLEGVFSLRDRSLLSTEEQLGETRYEMLTLVREYAAEKAEDLPVLRARHAAHYLQIAQEWGEKIGGREQREALARLDMEYANFEAALRWADEQQDWPMVARFVSALGEYAHTRGRITPFVAEVIQRAANALVGTGDTASQATLLFALGAMAWMQRRFAEGEDCVNISLQYYRESQLHERACRALNLLGLIAASQGRCDLARQRFQEGLAICDEVGAQQEKALLLQNLSALELRLGSEEEARALAEEGLRINRALGDEMGASYKLHMLGLLALRRGDVAEGHRLLAESLQIRAQLNDKPGLARSFWTLGALHLAANDLENAALLLLTARRLEVESLLPGEAEDAETYAALCNRLDAQTLARFTAQVAETSLEEMIAYARALLERTAGA